MKKQFLIVLFIIPLQLFSQDYKLFTATSKKLFTDFPAPNNTYSLSIESTRQIGTDSLYYNFFKVSSDWIESDTCMFWGGPICNQQNAPAWAGKRVEFDNIETWCFYNLNNDSISFAFNTIIDGPIQFFRDSIQQFEMMYVGEDSMTVLGQADTVRTFAISHTDLEGNTIDSPLNEESIVISKQFGLVRFFVIDSFPSVLKPLSIIGNVSPTAGFYQLTNEMVYDYQVGDEVQYKETSWFQPPAPPWYYYTRYRKYIFLEREQTDDSLIYRIRQELFYKDSTGIVIDTITKKYESLRVIAQIPFEKFDGSWRSFRFVEYCEQERWTYSVNNNVAIVFCEADTCWGAKDVGYYPEEQDLTYVCGLGLYINQRKTVQPDGYFVQEKIGYFKKNEEECGNEVIVGINDFDKPSPQITLSPNPANGLVHISSSFKMKQFVLRDLHGNNIMRQSISTKEISIDASQLSDGLYFVNLLLENGNFATKKLSVVKK